MQQREQEQGYAPGIGGFKTWLDTATPDQTIDAAKISLTAVGRLNQVERERFYREVRQDQTLVGLLDELKTPA